MPVLHHHDRALVYDRRGTGPPIVFQHGLGAARAQALDATSGLTGCSVIAMDAPSHGDSEDAPEFHSFDALGNAVVALLDHLDIDRAVLGGISMGSGIGLNVALRYPRRVAGLILVRPAWLDAPHPSSLAIVARLGAWLRQYGPDGARRRLHADAFFARLRDEIPGCAASIERVLDAPGVDPARDARGRVLVDMVASVPCPDLAALRALTLPAIVVASASDPLHPVEMAHTIADAMPNASFVSTPPRYLEPSAHARAVTAAMSTFMA